MEVKVFCCTTRDLVPEDFGAETSVIEMPRSQSWKDDILRMRSVKGQRPQVTVAAADVPDIAAFAVAGIYTCRRRTSYHARLYGDRAAFSQNDGANRIWEQTKLVSTQRREERDKHNSPHCLKVRLLKTQVPSEANVSTLSPALPGSKTT